MACFSRHRPFTALSRRQRRRKVFALKQLIHRERARCGGLFYDACDIDYYRQHPDHPWRWSDIYFTGRDPAVLWNAEIITARMALEDLISDRVFDEAYQQLSEAERGVEFRFETRPNYNSQGKLVSRTLIHREKPRYARFNGLTFNEYTEQREAEILTTQPPAVYCGYKRLPGFAYGIGLRMVVEAEALSVEVINAAIDDFKARGEKAWHSPERPA
jgi:hypothetical protein